MSADLRCENIHAGYLGPDIVRGFSTCFSAGELSIILGANGAGKSTLLRVIAGLMLPRQGEVSVGGQSLNGLPALERARRVACVPQLTMEPVPLSVAEVVALGRYYDYSWGGKNGISNPAIHTSLDVLGIAQLATRHCDTLSGGEWRKVLVAQGLAQQAQALLLDEPTAFLDPPAQYSLMRNLREYAKQTKTVVVAVLHDPALAKQCADNVMLLRDGQVLAQGAPQGMLTPALLCETYGVKVPWWEETK